MKEEAFVMESRFSKRKATISGLSAVLVVAVALVTSLVAWVRQDDSAVNVSTKVLGAQVVQANGNSQGNGATNGNGNDSKGSFNIATTGGGQVQGLYPGAVVALPLTLSNPNSFGIRVTSVTVAVQTPVPPAHPQPGPACAATDIQVGTKDASGFHAATPLPASIAVSVDLAKNGHAPTSAVWLRMVPNPHNACQDTTFPLSYGGSAVKS
jgi:hypothetical protein